MCPDIRLVTGYLQLVTCPLSLDRYRWVCEYQSHGGYALAGMLTNVVGVRIVQRVLWVVSNAKCIEVHAQHLTYRYSERLIVYSW